MVNAKRSELVELLRWKKFPVLDDGFVCLVDVMGDDTSVVQAARVSYGKDVRLHVDDPIVQAKLEELFPKGDTRLCNPDGGPAWSGSQIQHACEILQEEQASNDRTLIRYLMRHRHSTPLEMAELKFLVRVPMDCWRQWIRHRTASVNEYSTRYTEAIDSQQKTPPDQWRLQSGSNKQGSEGFLIPLEGGEAEGSIAHALSRKEMELHEQSRAVYEHRLGCGIAKEQARKDLPLSTYTEAFWKINLHNLLHFLGLRMHEHAQKEIRDYATIIGEQIVAPLFPIVWEAFLDYHPHMGGMMLSRLDIKAISLLLDENKAPFAGIMLGGMFTNKRERDECITKLRRLGFNISD